MDNAADRPVLPHGFPRIAAVRLGGASIVAHRSGAVVRLRRAVPIRDDLFGWLGEQPAWQQDLAKRLTRVVELSDDERATASTIVRSAFGALTPGVDVPDLERLTIDDLPDGNVTGAPRLRALGPMRGVGAIHSEQRLTFEANGLTVVYGQNAAGKSTYVRALKRICRSIDRDTNVRGNVFEPAGPGPPSAAVEVETNGQVSAARINLGNPAHDMGLDALSVFDSTCAETYLDARNVIAYVPPSIRLLARLAALQDRIRAELAAEVEAVLLGAPAFPEFRDPSPARHLVGNLTADTAPQLVAQLTTLTNVEMSRLAELRVALAPGRDDTVGADAQAARQDAAHAQGVIAQLDGLAGAVSAEASSSLQAAARAVDEAEAALAALRGDWQGLPVAEAGSEPWRVLWEAARTFSEGTGTVFPPPAGGWCPLCMQVVSQETSARMAHFEAHVHSVVTQQRDQATLAMRTQLARLDPRHIDECRSEFVAGLSDREAELALLVDAAIDGLEERMAELRATRGGAEGHFDIETAKAALTVFGARRTAHAETLEAAHDPEAAAALRAELFGLAGRELLRNRQADVLAWIDELKRVAVIERARTGLATNRLTTKQRELSEEIVTGMLDTNLRLEMRHLSCDHLPVALDPHTAVGQTQVALRLAGADGAPAFSEIASEGEQRALSLAFFFAEIAASESDGGIVVDDPVSSLDDERRDHIAARLIEMAARQQVIVFTHDLPFMLDLTDRAEEAGVATAVRGVWRMGADVGRVDDHPPFKAMKLRERIGVLTSRVEQWDQQGNPTDFDEAWRRVCDFYRDARVTWERAVEERLFKGVVQRFQREVKTLSLDNVVVTEDLKAMIRDGMTRCSMFVHDEPPGAGVTLPDRAALARDVAKLSEFFEATR